MADVKVDTIVDDDAVAARVEVKVGGVTMTYTGSAKRHPKDFPDYVTGEVLAISRAFGRAQADLQKIVDHRVEYPYRPLKPVEGF